MKMMKVSKTEQWLTLPLKVPPSFIQCMDHYFCIVSMQVVIIINAGQFSTIICRRVTIITLSTYCSHFVYKRVSPTFDAITSGVVPATT